MTILIPVKKIEMLDPMIQELSALGKNKMWHILREATIIAETHGYTIEENTWHTWNVFTADVVYRAMSAICDVDIV